MDGLLVPGTMCDHEFVSSQSTPQYGRFYSPRYPSSYPKNIRCSYLFRARLKERIRLVFEEISLQKGDLSCLNRADLIKVHDGTDSGAPTIAVLCNQGTEVEVLSTGPGLYVEFVANSEWPGQGFKAMFQFQPLDDALHPEPDKVPGAVTGNPKYSVIGPAVSATRWKEGEKRAKLSLVILNLRLRAIRKSSFMKRIRHYGELQRKSSLRSKADPSSSVNHLLSGSNSSRILQRPTRVTPTGIQKRGHVARAISIYGQSEHPRDVEFIMAYSVISSRVVPPVFDLVTESVRNVERNGRRADAINHPKPGDSPTGI
ncbi:NETO2 protein, partial [Acromyrmex insinuator]